MIRSISTLKALINELKPDLINSKITDVFTQEKGKVIIELLNDVGFSKYIEFSTLPPYDYLIKLDEFHRKTYNSLDLFPILLEQKIRDIYLLNYDRIIVFRTDKFLILFVLYGNAKSNFVITNREKKLIASLSAEKIEIDEFFANKKFIKLIDLDKNLELVKAITKTSFYPSKYYAEYFCEQMSFNSECKLSDYSDKQIVLIDSLFEDFFEDIYEKNESYLYCLGNSKYLFSLLELSDYQLYKKYGSISEGIKWKVIKESSEKEFNNLYSKFQQRIEKALNKLLNQKEKIIKLEDAQNLADKYRNIAELLVSQRNPKILTGENFILKDWDGKIIDINLKKEKTLLENAEIYFKKAKSVIIERKKLAEQLPKIEQKIDSLESILKELKEINRLKELEKIMKKNTDYSKGLIEINERTHREEKFRKFILSDKYILYVGKDAANNDELTMKFAKPNDIWLHARGVGGSHCVIKSAVKETIPKEILEKAAQISAYYSQSRNAKFTPVIYTEKKHVRKPRGANPGQVLVAKEKVIMVEPKLELD